MPSEYRYPDTNPWGVSLHGVSIQSHRGSPFNVRSPNSAMVVGCLLDDLTRFDAPTRVSHGGPRLTPNPDESGSLLFVRCFKRSD